MLCFLVKISQFGNDTLQLSSVVATSETIFLFGLKSKRKMVPELRFAKIVVIVNKEFSKDDLVTFQVRDRILRFRTDCIAN